MKIYPDKICIQCKRPLQPTTDNFYVNKLAKDGLSSKCKRCCLEYDKAYRNRKRQERKEKAEKWLNDFDQRMEAIKKDYEEKRNNLK